MDFQVFLQLVKMMAAKHQVEDPHAHLKSTMVRHSYGNACLYCFKEDDLRRCSACKTVFYCCIQHQASDWPKHKAECKAIKTTNQTFADKKNLTLKEFQEYKNNIATNLKKNMQDFEYSEALAKFPWVCAFCYSRENLNFQCEDCTAVVYCSSGHKQKDEKNHEEHCKNLKMVKMISSYGYENGYKGPVPDEFNVISKKMRISLTDMQALYKILTKKKVFRDELEKSFHYNIFTALFAMGTTIYYALEKIKWVSSHVYQEKQTLNQEEKFSRICKRMSGTMDRTFLPISEVYLDLTYCMIIHVVDSPDDDLMIFFHNVASFLVDWVSNIDSVKIIFCGASSTHPPFPHVAREVSPVLHIQAYPVEYRKITKSIDKPDLIILPNYTGETFDFSKSANGKFLFEYRNVPVIITSPIKSKLNKLVDSLKNIEGVKVLLNIEENSFKSNMPYRMWDEKTISTLFKHNFLTVLCKN